MRFMKDASQTKSANLPLLVILSFGICSFGLVVWRAGFDNLLRTLPPFYMLFCYLLFLARNKFIIPSAKSAERLSLRRLTLNVLSVSLPFLFIYEMSVHHGYYAGSIGAMKQETTPIQLDRLKAYTNPAEAEWLKQVTNRIEIYSDKGDPILALPLNPIFYFLTDRINPLPYDWILPGMLDKQKELEVVEQLQTRLPRVVIYVDIPIDGKEERRLARYAPELFKFLTENYMFEEAIGIFQILLPKNQGH